MIWLKKCQYSTAGTSKIDMNTGLLKKHHSIAQDSMGSDHGKMKKISGLSGLTKIALVNK